MSDPVSAARVLGVAVAVPGPYAEQLRGWRRRLGDPAADGVPTHITLLPPTTVDEVLIEEIVRHLDGVAARCAPFDVHLHGTGTFRPVSPVVYVSLAQGVTECGRLENVVRSGVLWRPVAYPYHPHVTVAHGVSESALDEAEEGLGDYDARFRVEAFRLYEHEDHVWRTTREFALRGPDEPVPGA